jgi:hypothetical protein
MKTGVAIPDDIVRDAIRLARKLGKPRRQILREALAEYEVRHDADSFAVRSPAYSLQPTAYRWWADLASPAGSEPGFRTDARREVFRGMGRSDRA